ncbi:uncharacterized protein PHACADRAFT_206469 [Phanerochaete carnosa HHB-10118-sp]|uniref:Uncharacterized protein n=1 Tax=Phanerochaete carnosa (strain HHB-10118-sp) TaxID=650164 RepID=K5W144_PHACS|nr:uncharacterized protein PHACADRAFT_206469 [Phanerochaete carnosa HHB-10118-sp]EKM57573.1 hypothetical protein PHACADRAFT_206469 [Phanerochaete carnosa HHB-10118-sp]
MLLKTCRELGREDGGGCKAQGVYFADILKQYTSRTQELEEFVQCCRSKDVALMAYSAPDASNLPLLVNPVVLGFTEVYCVSGPASMLVSFQATPNAAVTVLIKSFKPRRGVQNFKLIINAEIAELPNAARHSTRGTPSGPAMTISAPPTSVRRVSRKTRVYSMYYGLRA